jgi:hypothetical protein
MASLIINEERPEVLLQKKIDAQELKIFAIFENFETDPYYKEGDIKKKLEDKDTTLSKLIKEFYENYLKSDLTTFENLVNPDGYTFLLLSVKNYMVKTVKTILEFGVSLDYLEYPKLYDSNYDSNRGDYTFALNLSIQILLQECNKSDYFCELQIKIFLYIIAYYLRDRENINIINSENVFNSNIGYICSKLSEENEFSKKLKQKIQHYAVEMIKDLPELRDLDIDNFCSTPTEAKAEVKLSIGKYDCVGVVNEENIPKAIKIPSIPTVYSVRQMRDGYINEHGRFVAIPDMSGTERLEDRCPKNPSFNGGKSRRKKNNIRKKQKSSRKLRKKNKTSRKHNKNKK